MKKFSIFIILLFPIIALAQQAQNVNLVPLDMGLTQQTVVVNVNSTAIPSTPLSGRKTMIIQNTGSNTVYIGNSTVTADTNSTGGVQVLAGKSFQADFGADSILYGIVASGNSTVAVLEAK